MKVKDIMRTKFITTHENSTFFDIIKIMVDQKTNSIIITDNDGKYIRLIDSYEVIKKVIPDYLRENEILASVLMDELQFKEACLAAKDLTISSSENEEENKLYEDDKLIDAAIMMLDNGLQRIPVLNREGFPVGLITRTEMKRVIATFLGIDKYPE